MIIFYLHITTFESKQVGNYLYHLVISFSELLFSKEICVSVSV